MSDDGSVDGTVENVRRFREHAPFPVHVQRNEQRLGYDENFLKAANTATGDIAFRDQDDVWHPDKIGQHVGRFRQGIRTSAVHPPLQLPPGRRSTAAP